MTISEMEVTSGGVDVAVSRATVWTLLTSAVVGLYIVVVWAVGRLLPVDDEVAGLLAAASLALAVQPLRSWLQRRVDRIVYGDDVIVNTKQNV